MVWDCERGKWKHSTQERRVFFFGMDLTPSQFKSYIQAAFLPTVVVLCTPGVEKACLKQGIKFVDAFRSAILEKRRSKLFHLIL